MLPRCLKQGGAWARGWDSDNDHVLLERDAIAESRGSALRFADTSPIDGNGMGTPETSADVALELLTVAEAARILRQRPETVRRAIHGGQLEAVRVGHAGPLRVPAAALRRHLRVPASGRETE